jgi:hypothetical protein
MDLCTLRAQFLKKNGHISKTSPTFQKNNIFIIIVPFEKKKFDKSKISMYICKGFGTYR